MPIGRFTAIKFHIGATGSYLTNIKCDAGESYPKAYIYLVSTHGNGGDATKFEYGIVRLGYSGGHVTKEPIKSNGGIIFEFINLDGYVAIKSSGYSLFVSIFG